MIIPRERRRAIKQHLPGGSILRSPQRARSVIAIDVAPVKRGQASLQKHLSGAGWKIEFHRQNPGLAAGDWSPIGNWRFLPFAIFSDILPLDDKRFSVR